MGHPRAVEVGVVAEHWGPTGMVFLDTEFFRARQAAQLLSLALVEGADEVYVELDESSIARSLRARRPAFAQRHVLPQFGRVPNSAGPIGQMSERAVEWLNRRLGSVVTVHYDFSVDFELLEGLVACAKSPVVVTLRPANVAYLLEEASGIAAAAKCWAQVARERGLERHHALADALALQARFAAVHGL